ncbi:hypothetical protein QTL95_10240 [Rhizobium sp. S152]|nr:hypothetical protein [Rhizobium sp. S152]MDM9626277.1 hypothetical protein [Rhizobium sp. S152]
MGQHASFMEVKKGKVVDYWKVPTSAADKSESSIGRAYCYELLEIMRADKAPYLLGWVMQAMAAKGSYGAIEIGFCQALAEKALRMSLNTELPQGMVYDDGETSDEQAFERVVAPRVVICNPRASKPKKAVVLSEEDQAARLDATPRDHMPSRNFTSDTIPTHPDRPVSHRHQTR